MQFFKAVYIQILKINNMILSKIKMSYIFFEILINKFEDNSNWSEILLKFI